MSVWVAGATVVAGIGSSVISSNKAAKSQKAQLALEREKLKFAQQRYDQAQTMYGGLQQKVVDSAMEGVRPDLQGVSDRAAADIAGQFRGAQLGLARTNQRLGINPNSGQYQSQMRQTALGEALAKAGGITRAREGERNNAEQQTFARRFQVSQVGVNQMNNTASNVQDASSGLAGVYGQQANGWNQASAAGMQAAFSALPSLVGGLNGGGAGFTSTSSSPLATGLSSYQPAKTFALGEAAPPLVSTPLT
jgi:hypothetical protein